MEPLAHVLIPLLFLLAFFPKLEKKYVYGLLFLTILIDFDFLLVTNTTHRYLFHNVFFVFLVGLLVYLLWNLKASLVSLYYLFSHLLIDFYIGSVALFWPLYKKFFTVVFDVTLSRSFDLNYEFDIIIKSISEVEFTPDGHLATTLGLVLFILLLIMIIAINRKKIKKLFKKLI